MLSALLLGDQTEVGIIRISQESGELSCPTDTKVKIRKTFLTLIVNISTYNIDIENRLRQVLCLSEPIRMIYVSLGLDENWVSYRVPQPRIEVVGPR